MNSAGVVCDFVEGILTPMAVHNHPRFLHHLCCVPASIDDHRARSWTEVASLWSDDVVGMLHDWDGVHEKLAANGRLESHSRRVGSWFLSVLCLPAQHVVSSM